MRAIELVREARYGNEPVFSPREIALATKALSRGTTLVTISGSSLTVCRTLSQCIGHALTRNADWGLETLARLHERMTGRNAADPTSLAGLLEALFDLGVPAVRQGHSEKGAFLRALGGSAHKIREALSQLAHRLDTTLVIMVDADRWPATRGSHSAGDTLVDLVALLAQNPLDVRLVVAGTKAEVVHPRGVDGFRSTAITVR